MLWSSQKHMCRQNTLLQTNRRLLFAVLNYYGCIKSSLLHLAFNSQTQVQIYAISRVLCPKAAKSVVSVGGGYGKWTAYKRSGLSSLPVKQSKEICCPSFQESVSLMLVFTWTIIILVLLYCSELLLYFGLYLHSCCIITYNLNYLRFFNCLKWRNNDYISQNAMKGTKIMFAVLAWIETLLGFRPQLFGFTLSSTYPRTSLCDFKGNCTMIAKDSIWSTEQKPMQSGISCFVELNHGFANLQQKAVLCNPKLRLIFMSMIRVLKYVKKYLFPVNWSWPVVASEASSW